MGSHAITREPPAGTEFDIAPAPPQKTEIRTTTYTGPLTHTGALRRTLIDPVLAAQAVPAHWLLDDPGDSSAVTVCGVRLEIPDPFEALPVGQAYEAALDRAEQKFRAGRKDKFIGGELGSIVVKKKLTRPKKIPTIGGASKRYSLPSEFAPQNIGHGSLKRGSPASSDKDLAASLGAHAMAASSNMSGGPLKKQRTGAGDMDRARSVQSNEDTDYTKSYRRVVKAELVKAARQRGQSSFTQTRLAKSVASACAREARKGIWRSVRLADDFHRRGRRILRDVLQYWKREDKDRQEERKKVMARAEEVRRVEAEEREAQRQKNKLKFLLGQSEAFSSFLQAKAKATDEAAAQDAAQTDAGPETMDGITGTEDDEELRRMSEANAARLVEEHQKRLSNFDTETSKRKRIANEEAATAAAVREEVARAMPAMAGITSDEMAALRDQAASSEQETADAAKKRLRADSAENAPAEDGTVDGKPEVAAVKQPTILNCKMKDYQLRGLSWLVSLYDQGINGILADEMGLGKTLQTISFLAYLAEEEDNWGPFLVVTPKATLHNWQQEVTKFCPDLKVLPYWGNKSDRAELRKYWSAKRMYRRDSEFQVCITSYETLTTDERHFSRVKWQYLVLDEAQAIKNSSSSRWRALLQFPCRNRLLLTGTPLQNKLSELWALLHFIMPTIFDNHAEFADWFAKDIEGHAKNNKILDLATLARLRTLLDPFMLRRVKRDVESEMPPKTEVQLRCQLTSRQRQLYANVRANIPVADLMRTMGATGGGNGAKSLDPGSSSQLMNIVMQLRKVCNHPETFERRTAVSPYQFQATPPPSHVPLPPAVLTGAGPVPPIDMTLLTRSDITLTVPRALIELEDAFFNQTQKLRRTCFIWRPDYYVHHYRLQSGHETSSAALPHLCGGFSASEMWTVMTSAVLPEFSWRLLWTPHDEHLCRLSEVYDTSRYVPAVDSAEENTECDSARSVMDRPHRILMQVRAGELRRSPMRVLLPGHDSPADLIERHTRMLRSSSVYVPAATAPSPSLYIPGDCRAGTQLALPAASNVYPGMAGPQDPFSTAFVYDTWRGMLGSYGAHVGTEPILMPEAGRLVADSGKMTVLDPLLRRLKAEGHKCLIYSQFTRVLDILEDYCGKTGYKFVRLDGQSALADRRDIVADWQTNDELFVFLLSTRAGGVGLNLTAADTVIFFDSDWNPTQDLQAMDRAHRLGQERPVTVYRLTSRGTIEERMLIRAQQKSRINDLVIKGGGLQTDNEEMNEAEIDDIAALLIGEGDDDDGEDDQMLERARRAAALVRTMPSHTSGHHAPRSRLVLSSGSVKRGGAARYGCELEVKNAPVLLRA